MGTTFPNATVHCPLCLPSRSSLWTGQPPHQTGFFNNNGQAYPFYKTKITVNLPAILQNAGYNTVLTGKWHLDTHPVQDGISEPRIWLTGGNTAYFNSTSLSVGPNVKNKLPPSGYTQDIFGDDAVNFINSDESKQKPFLLWLGFTAPHSSYGPNPIRFQNLYKGKLNPAIRPPIINVNKMNWNLYYQAISHMDEQFGRVAKALNDNGLFNNTIIIFISDNGLMGGVKGYTDKQVPFEGSIRVPITIYAPMLTDSHTACPIPISSLDIPPTILSLVGITPPAAWVGNDITPSIRGENQNIEYAISEFNFDDPKLIDVKKYRIIRTLHYKLIVWTPTANRPAEFYDILNDHDENTNLVNVSALASVRNDLYTKLIAWETRTADLALSWPRPF